MRYEFKLDPSPFDLLKETAIRILTEDREYKAKKAAEKAAAKKLGRRKEAKK